VFSFPGAVQLEDAPRTGTMELLFWSGITIVCAYVLEGIEKSEGDCKFFDDNFVTLKLFGTLVFPQILVHITNL
jgi:hypothetical protein